MNFKELESSQKLRGGYYTPADIADFLVRWIAVKEPQQVLEPACGDGVFLDGISRILGDPELHAFELDENEAIKASKRARARGLKRAKVVTDDFLGWALDVMRDRGESFDAVVGNPPFIRYQYLPGVFQARSELIFDELDCKFTKHTNAWVPFILASVALLKPGGRLAMVVPAEIIHVMHAQSLRSYLGRECRRIVIIDPEELWFEGTLQGAVILLAEKKATKRTHGQGLGIFPVRGRTFLEEDPESLFRKPTAINGKTVAGKWTRAILAPTTRELLDELEEREDVHRFQDIADVDVGIVTGANKFFLVSEDTVRRYGLSRWAHPMFGRSDHCPGVIYDERQHRENADSGKPTNFVWFTDRSVEQNPVARSYIELGERENLHKRYKCRIRAPWYAVPSVYATEIGMLKRCNDTPRLILNKISAFTTDTAYRIRARIGSAEQLVFSFLNALTALSAELEGRHYGGGVLELVPSEIEKLLLPISPKVEPDLIDLDKAIRSMPTGMVLERQSEKVLGALRVSKQDQLELLSGWQKLRDRRHRVSTETA